MKQACHNNRTIFLIEDDEAILESLKEILELSAYSVLSASNGKQALDMLKERRATKKMMPSLILLDLMMPVMDGFEFRSQQLLEGEISDIPVVVMSAAGQIDKKVKEISVTAYLKKPINIDVLLETVDRYSK
ncbi:MAG: response regulator [Bacteriovoracia bacterium]